MTGTSIMADGHALSANILKPEYPKPMTDQNAQTQRIYATDNPPCASHEFRISHLEKRMDKVETLHDLLSKLSTNVEILNDRTRLLLWVSGIVATGIIMSVIGALTYLLTNTN